MKDVQKGIRKHTLLVNLKYYFTYFVILFYKPSLFDFMGEPLSIFPQNFKHLDYFQKV